jgi:hypothetical protein
MPKRFRSPWGDKRPPKTLGRPAASAEADSESGDEGADGGDKDLYALDVMRKRGLISEEDYRRRRAKIEAGGEG